MAAVNGSAARHRESIVPVLAQLLDAVVARSLPIVLKSGSTYENPARLTSWNNHAAVHCPRSSAARASTARAEIVPGDALASDRCAAGTMNREENMDRSKTT